MRKLFTPLLILGIVCSLGEPLMAQYYPYSHYNPYQYYNSYPYRYPHNYARYYQRVHPPVVYVQRPVQTRTAYSRPVYSQPVYSQPVYTPPTHTQQSPTLPAPPNNSYQEQQKPMQTTQLTPEAEGVILPPAADGIVEESEKEVTPIPAPDTAPVSDIPIITEEAVGSCPPGGCPDGKCASGTCPTGTCPTGTCPTGTCSMGVCPTGTCGVDNCPTCDCGLGECYTCTPRKHWWVSAFGEYLYLTPRGVDVPFAETLDGFGNPQGDVGVADPDYASGFRAGAAGSWDNGRTILEGTYSWYESSTEAGLSTAPLVLDPLVDLEGFFFADSTTAAARYDIDFQMGDVDIKRALLLNPNHSLFVLFGGRYAHLGQDLQVSYSNNGGTNVITEIEFDGGGPRIGLEGDYRLGCGAFLHGSSVVSLLFGHFGASYLQENDNPAFRSQSNFGDDRIVPVLELELGAGWQSPQGRVRLMAGYHAGLWFNTMTTNSWIQAVQSGNFTTNGDNLSELLTFDGVFGRVELRY